MLRQLVQSHKCLHCLLSIPHLLPDRELLGQLVQGGLCCVLVSKGTAEGVLYLKVLRRQLSIWIHSSGSHEGEEAVQGRVGCCLWFQPLSTICNNAPVGVTAYVYVQDLPSQHIWMIDLLAFVLSMLLPHC